MKLKISEWGNSHGVRMSTVLMEHLQVKAGDEVEIALTDKGIEIVKNYKSMSDLASVQAEVLEAIIQQTEAVKTVEDPYNEAEVAYLVFAIDPCSPLIREVPKGTPNAHATLADAKEAARQIIQSSIESAHKSLANLRQLGIDNISYISL